MACKGTKYYVNYQDFGILLAAKEALQGYWAQKKPRATERQGLWMRKVTVRTHLSEYTAQTRKEIVGLGAGEAQGRQQAQDVGGGGTGEYVLFMHEA